MKKLFLILILSLCVGCSNVKKIPVTTFDYEHMKEVVYLSDKQHQKIDKNYQVANNHFEYVKAHTGNCISENKIDPASDEKTYLVIEPIDTTQMSVHIYQKVNKQCQKLQTLTNVVQVATNSISYHNRVYLNVIFNGAKAERSGLWVLDRHKQKQLSHLQTMSAYMAIDRATGHLYTIEPLADNLTYLREYDQKDQQINQYHDKNDVYLNLYIHDNQLSLISPHLVGKQEDESLYNYLVTTFKLKNFFSDLRKAQAVDILEVDTNIPITAGEVKNNYIVFDGGTQTVICLLDYTKCQKYNSYVEMFDGQGYIGITKGEADNDDVYINKFGTNGVEKVLTSSQAYTTYQEGKNIYFEVFDGRYEDKSKIIKYTLK